MSQSIIAQKGPYLTELVEGEKYAWCACGRSANQPFCDGSHKEVAMAPVVFTAEKNGMAALCGCKKSGTAPFCNGTHNDL